MIEMRALDTDETNDRDFLKRLRHMDGQLIAIARELHRVLLREGPMRIGEVRKGFLFDCMFFLLKKLFF